MPGSPALQPTMVDPMRTVLAGPENFIVFLFVVVISIIVQIIKAAKQGSATGGTPPTPGGGDSQEYSAPPDELRAFLEKLGASVQPPSVPRPPPPVPRAAVPAIVAPVGQHRPSSPTAEPASPSTPAELPRARQEPAPPAVTFSAPAWAVPMAAERQKSRATAGIVRMLKQAGSARQAIVLREILGPPVAMRGVQNATGSGPAA